ncbi:MAG TPA: cysteine synthase A [Desulfotomaculum sp.]|nr:cysteine synthase A [Desulfotomaculum sp.]
MTVINDPLTALIGNTPLVPLTKLGAGLPAQVAAKCEWFNPGGSAKDRAALWMLKEALTKGIIREGGTIIEPTSGNTGISLAWLGLRFGLRVLLTMPQTMSQERRLLLEALGAEVVLTPGAEGLPGAVRRAKELAAEIPGAVILNQFANPANPESHYQTTGPEIWQDTGGTVDIVVAGIGTGGTLTGIARALKERKPGVKTVAVEPAESPVLSGGTPGSHGIQGIGAGFVPEVVDRSLIDEIIPVATDAAVETARSLARKEGLLVGISSGAACHAALAVARRPENAGKLLVTVFPDGAERYLSAGIFARLTGSQEAGGSHPLDPPVFTRIQCTTVTLKRREF